MSLLNNINKLKEHLKSLHISHEEEILKLNTLKDANIYCVINNITSQQYGPLLEKFIQSKFNFIKNKASSDIGNCCKGDKNYEIKVSLGGQTHKKFNFVQIRFYQDCDIYIFTAYHLSNENVDNAGELYIFRIPKIELEKIIIQYGGYAHGTYKKQGPITFETLQNKNNAIKEYSIRPNINDNCWNNLLLFRILESEL